MAKALSKVVSAAVVGNIIEVYDMSIYGYLAAFIAINFFPQHNTMVGLVNTFAVFFLGFLARPLGSILFGYIGDRRGRKAALVLSVLLMAGATCAMGLLPTYHSIGGTAAILLIILRLLQGFSVGGEYLGSSIFLVEHAPEKRRGLFGGFAMLSGNAGMLVAAATAWAVTYFVPHQAIIDYGWRIPFIGAIIGGAAGLWLRLRASETKAFQEVQRHNTRLSHPLVESFVYFRRALISIVGLTWLGVVATYLLVVFMPTYMSSVLHYGFHEAITINLLSVVSLLIWIPIAGMLSDRFGRRIMMAIGGLGLMIGIVPYYSLLMMNNYWIALAAQCGIMIPLGVYCGVTPTCIVEMVPPHVRFSATTFAYNIGAAIFGGTTPLIAIWLIHKTGFPLSPGYYLIFCGLFSLAAIYRMDETAKSKLKPIGIV
ncbi:MAG: MFS transporter [Coxiellaceae bacterium]|nr:MFS transporter [Coxiellaceae bacterium]